MDGGADGGPVLEQRLDDRHHLVGGVGVEARGGLVQEDDPRVGDQGDADVGALGLAATDALGHGVADEDVAAGFQCQLLDHLLGTAAGRGIEWRDDEVTAASSQ